MDDEFFQIILIIMSQIRFFTEEQEALIPQLQAKWQAVALSTERIDRQEATAALDEIYSVMGKPAPEIIFCAGGSPQFD